jgi:hypothetical protein
MDYIKQSLAIDNDHYPELLRRMYIVNAPGYFSFFWKIIKPMFDPTTAEKVRLLRSVGRNGTHGGGGSGMRR